MAFLSASPQRQDRVRGMERIASRKTFCALSVLRFKLAMISLSVT